MRAGLPEVGFVKKHPIAASDSEIMRLNGEVPNMANKGRMTTRRMVEFESSLRCQMIDVRWLSDGCQMGVRLEGASVGSSGVCGGR